MKVRWTPLLTTARAEIKLFAFQCRKSEPIGNGQLIRKYKDTSAYRNIQIPQADEPPLGLKHRGLAYLCIKIRFLPRSSAVHIWIAGR